MELLLARTKQGYIIFPTIFKGFITGFIKRGVFLGDAFAILNSAIGASALKLAIMHRPRKRAYCDKIIVCQTKCRLGWALSQKLRKDMAQEFTSSI